MPQENTPALGAPSRGSLVIYRSGQGPDGQGRYRIGEVVGPVAVDPVNDGTWVGVRLPAHTFDLVECATIVNIVPPR